jgi:thiol:disulfide interchange protein DsbA
MFADYFCPPCRRIDTKAEPLLKELLATNKVKITFIDVPFHNATPIYAKYYLYAANVNSDANNILRVRKILFNAAQDRHIQTEEALIAYLKEQKISWKVFDEKSILTILSDIIRKNMIANTPTCIIKYSSTDVKKYIGDDKIWEGLTTLKKNISEGKK